MPEKTVFQKDLYVYRSVDGRVANFDLAKMTISFEEETIQFTDCSSSEEFCLSSYMGKIVVPKKCNPEVNPNPYISSSLDLEFIGLEGLSGNVFKAFKGTGRFGYAYNFDNGIVQMILIPSAAKISIFNDKTSIPQYTYRVAGFRGPLPCNHVAEN
jgi:hypothetical protein